MPLPSAAAFGTSGTFGSFADHARVGPRALVIRPASASAALVLAVPTWLALRGQWQLLGTAARSSSCYAVLAVACAQVFYFNAVQRLSVGVALMLEYLGIILVVGWMWARHGRKPARLTVVGSVLALVGLALVLDLFGGDRSTRSACCGGSAPRSAWPRFS